MEGAVGEEGGNGLNYNIADGSTSVGCVLGGGHGTDQESFPGHFSTFWWWRYKSNLSLKSSVVSYQTT